jgi:hypothetical protein
MSRESQPYALVNRPCSNRLQAQWGRSKDVLCNTHHQPKLPKLMANSSNPPCSCIISKIIGRQQKNPAKTAILQLHRSPAHHPHHQRKTCASQAGARDRNVGSNSNCQRALSSSQTMHVTACLLHKVPVNSHAEQPLLSVNPLKRLACCTPSPSAMYRTAAWPNTTQPIP